ncbi:hypothetical protein [Actinomadura sp. BRA 177]|uniref:hypothetical protein n=1 Tax=Actinomadura sp. BRA 177 TaxID=2745202 RepID=UPI0020CC1FA9|nr:hypothetical protein [Actinomadura sp. BRA 177]
MPLVRQVRHALRLDLLRVGDQLPTVKDVVARLAINPNTSSRRTGSWSTRGSSRRVRASGPS